MSFRYRAGSPKNCVSHATTSSRCVSSRKRLIIFAFFFLFFSKDCVQRVLIRSRNFSGMYNPERKKSRNPTLYMSPPKRRKTRYTQSLSEKFEEFYYIFFIKARSAGFDRREKTARSSVTPHASTRFWPTIQKPIHQPRFCVRNGDKTIVGWLR